ncbi:MAG: hypothetical protein ACJ741_18770 [Pyrinomonadaceae bacterium]
MNQVGLLYICATAGLAVVTGSLFLIWKGRILIDTENNTVSEVQLPFGFRIRTQLPVVVMFFFGAFLLALPLLLIRKSFEMTPVVTLVGHIQSDQRPSQPLKAYAMAADCDATNEVRLKVPFVQDTDFKVLYYDKKNLVFDENIDWSKVVDGRYDLRPFVVTNETEQPANSEASVPPKTVVKETEAVASQYK